MTITRIGNTFTITNNEAYDILVIVKLLDDEGNFVSIDDDKVILTTLEDSYTLSDGEYLFEEWNNNTSTYVQTYKVLLGEEIKTCIQELLHGSLKKLPNDCECEPRETDQYYYTYVSVGLLWFTYLSLLNKIMIDNYVFSILDDAELLDLQRVKEIREGIESLCVDCATIKG